jgi:hypothetical protein
MPGNDHETLQVLIEVHELRLKPQYQAGIALLMSGSESPTEKANQMARSKTPQDYAAVRIMIGTWENIATHVQGFGPEQKQQLFKCNPILLMWKILEKAVGTIRQEGADPFIHKSTPNFAERFERLAAEYDQWRRTSAEYTTEESLAIRAMFG